MLFSATAASLCAEPISYIALDNGYEWDRISNRVNIGGPTIFVVGSTQTLKKLNSYQLGGRGQWVWCDAAFVRASGHYGFTWGGEYREGAFKGHAKGHSWDVQGGLGYYFGCCPFWFAPVVGWAYNEFDFTGKNIHTTIEGVTYNLSNIKATQRFNGPFVGFDMMFFLYCDIQFLFSYEYHVVNWHGDRLIQGPEFGNPIFGWSTGFSNKRHLHYARGNVFKLDTSYRFCDCWLLGLELKYQIYNGDFGHYHQTRRPLIPQFTFANIDGLWWRSFASTIYIGRMF